MPESIKIGAFVFGAVLLLVALLGGNFKLFGQEIASTVANRPIRLIAGIFASAFLVFSMDVRIPQLFPSTALPPSSSTTLPASPSSSNEDNSIVGEWKITEDTQKSKGIYTFNDNNFFQYRILQASEEEAIFGNGRWSSLHRPLGFFVPDSECNCEVGDGRYEIIFDEPFESQVSKEFQRNFDGNSFQIACGCCVLSGDNPSKIFLTLKQIEEWEPYIGRVANSGQSSILEPNLPN